MPKENKSKYAIMGMLSLAPMSGYDIKKHIEQSIGNFWNESYAQIYPILKQLVQNGWATMEKEEQVGKPDRNVYSLTEAGREELTRWLIEPVEYAPLRVELLLKLFFGHNLTIAQNIEHLEQYRERIRRAIQIYTEIEAALVASADHNPYWRYARFTVNFGRHSSEANLVWCEETLEELRSLQQAEQEATPKTE